MADDAFRTFTLNTPFQARTIHARLEKERLSLVAQLGDGYAKDWGDYQHRCGVIAGVKVAMEICEEVVKDNES